MKAAARAMWQQATQMVRDAAGNQQMYAEWVGYLASHDVRIQVPAIWALQQAGPTVIPSLIAGLSDAHVRIRRNCVDVIDHGGYGADARCVTGLLPLLRDPVAHIRKAVWHTLFCERCQAARHCEVPLAIPLDQVQLLIEIGIHDPNLKLRQKCIDDLAGFSTDVRAVHALKQLCSGQGKRE
jgi:HEAT repeat protein